MRIPVDIQFRNMDRSPALEAAVREKIEPLGRIESRAVGCRVTIEPVEQRHRHGTIHRFTIRLSVGNLRTEPRHVERAWVLLRAAAADLDLVGVAR